MAELIYDPEVGVSIINDTEVDNSAVFRALSATEPELAQLVRWTFDTKPQSSSRHGGLFDRDRFVSPSSIFGQFQTAYDAAEHDDVVSGIVESTEALAFSKMTVDCADPDEANVWGQIQEDLDLDGRLRAMWREDFIVSQFYCLPSSAHVYTTSGPVSIADSVVGQDVFAVKNDELVVGKITAKAATGVKPTWEIKTRNHTLRSTADHRFLVLTRAGSRDSRTEVTMEWRRADQIMKGDAVVTMASAPEVVAGLHPTADVAEIVGLLVGDGCRNERYAPTGPTQFKLCVPVGPDRDRWVRQLEDSLNVVVDARPDRCCIRFCSSELREWAWDVMRFTSPERFVPTWVWTSPRKVQEAFITGYLRADGYLDLRNGQSYRVACRSERLVTELRILCQYVGWPTSHQSVSENASGYKPGLVHSFTAYPESQRRQVTSGWARRDLRMADHLAARTVVSSGTTGDVEPVWDIEVDDAHSFIANGVVVHNCGVWWGQKSYKLKGKTDQGIARKKVFNDLTVPLGITILDPMKIVPVGNLFFNQQQLAYVASQGRELDVIQAVINGERDKDPLLAQILLEEWEPDDVERRMLSESGVPTARLFLLNPENVWRHTSTRSEYQRFASVRMKSVFPLLDLKEQLRQMDRATLLGATNFIVLVKKGDDKRPGTPAEIEALNAKVRMLARVPVIVGDQRLSIEIITPKTDMTLQPEKYNGLDARITARLYQMFMTGNFAAGAKGDDSLKIAKLVARGLESRRHMIRRSIEKNILEKIFERNDELTLEPELRFHPKRIALDFDPTFAQFLLELRDRGDLSRESILEEVDFDQVTEWQRRKYEAEKFDDIFQTQVPYSAPKGTPSPVKQLGGGTPTGADGAPNKRQLPVDPKAAGRRLGGKNNGGGAAPGTGQGQPARNPFKKSDGGPATQ